ncbi:MAG: urea ABC transporter ATP-binding subunit UrtE [Lachnospiraceae bacterium]|nr:urea ABC transporter ATP-binding subunit UrtE [Lachnospiraceae bacterium]
MNNVLALNDIHVSYGKSQVIHGLSLSIPEGGKTVILGRNGMGKTTTLKSIIGLLPVGEGNVSYLGKDINKKRSFERSIDGIAYVPQGREIIPDLNVEENIELGALGHTKDKAEIQKRKEMVLNYFPAMTEHLSRMGGILSGGQQQQLAICRALMSKPKILLLDEPTEGIQPNIVSEMGTILNKVNEELGVAILLVEQNLRFAFKVCNNFVVLEKGKIVLSGKKGEVPDSQIQAYLKV